MIHSTPYVKEYDRNGTLLNPITKGNPYFTYPKHHVRKFLFLGCKNKNYLKHDILANTLRYLLDNLHVSLPSHPTCITTSVQAFYHICEVVHFQFFHN